MINRQPFYEHCRQHLFASKIFQGQVDGINHIIDEWEKRELTDLRWLAYILATVLHETGRSMQPVEEVGKGKGHKYGTKTKQSGKPYLWPNKIYYGRGHTQNTWYENYEALTKQAIKEGKGWDFLHHPELLLQTTPSIWATFHGMLTGMYTGRRLSDYLNGEQADYVNARRIINGVDCAVIIAGYAKTFYEALKK